MTINKSRKIKVLHVFGEIKYSGAEIMYCASAPIFTKMNYELFALGTGGDIGEYSTELEKAGYTLIHMPMKSGSIALAKIFGITKLLKEYNIDLVHVHRSCKKFIFALATKISGIGCLYTFHNVFPTKWYSLPKHILERLIIKKILGCKFQTISDSVYNHELNVFKNTTIKVYNWYNSFKFCPAKDIDEKNKIREKIGLNKDQNVLVSIGGCSKIKRHEDIILAMHILKEKDFVYLHLGEGETTKEEIKLVNELGLANKVWFLGNQTNVRNYLVAADIYVMTSLFEGIAITTIEALACGIPAILYDVPGLRDFNHDDECTFLIDSDYKVLANSILKLIDDKQLSYQLAEKGRRMVTSRFDMKSSVQKINDLYNSVLNK